MAAGTRPLWQLELTASSLGGVTDAASPVAIPVAAQFLISISQPCRSGGARAEKDGEAYLQAIVSSVVCSGAKGPMPGSFQLPDFAHVVVLSAIERLLSFPRQVIYTFPGIIHCDRCPVRHHRTMPKIVSGFGIQYGVIPFRIGPDGIEVLLLTSRETRRWVIPKGWPMKGRTPRETAAQEAFEEAGLVGSIIGKRRLGSYHYRKRLANGSDILSQVRVFLFKVDHQEADWVEKDEREWLWVDPFRASQMVEEGGLAELLRDAFPTVRRLDPAMAKTRRLPK